MRNSLPVWLDAGILVGAAIVFLWRLYSVDRADVTADRTLTFLLGCFFMADAIKFGPMNDLLVSLSDARLVRLMAQLATVAAAAVCAGGALKAAGYGRRWAWLYVTPWGVVMCGTDALAGHREVEIESTDWGVWLLCSYAAAITGAVAIALAVTLWGWALTRSSRILAYASGAILLMVASGLNAASLAWRAVMVNASAQNSLTLTQKESNGWAFAAFTAFLALLCAIAGVVSTRRQHTVVGEKLPMLWSDLQQISGSDTLEPSALRRQTRAVRLVLECIEMLESIGVPPTTAARNRSDLAAASGPGRSVWESDEVIQLAGVWQQTNGDAAARSSDQPVEEPR